MTKKKSYKVRGLEKALESVPVEERFALGSEIRKAFANFDPANPPGQRVIAVEPGTRICPACGGKLVEFATIEAAEERPALRILDCESCDAPFQEAVARSE